MKWALGNFAMVLATLAMPATAAVTFTGTNGSLAAAATFDIVGTQLKVTLSNTSSADVTDASQVLTGVFFKVGGTNSLAIGAGTSAITGGDTNNANIFVSAAGANVSSEWAYLGGLNQYGANAGISSSGLGIFGPGDRFDTVGNLIGPTSPNGVEYGITSANDNINTGNGSIGLGDPLTKGSVSFLLNFSTFSLAQIGTVTFQYGTSLTETHFCGGSGCGPGGGGGGGGSAPEPGTALLAGLAMAAAVLVRRRKR
jgi:PEP-CTERM motif